MFHPPVPTAGSNPSHVERSLFRWNLLAALVLLAVMLGPFFAGHVSTRDDLGAFHLPIRMFYAEQLAHGEPFDWMPRLYCGFYLTGEGQAGTYHPWHLLLYRFLPLEAAWTLELWANYPFLLLGTYLFLGRKLGRRDAAMFGSLAFTFSGFMLLRFVHPNAVGVAAHIPWLLWAIDMAMLDTRPRRVAAAQAGVALLSGSQLLLGYPQYLWFSLLAEGFYVLLLPVVGRWSMANNGPTGGMNTILTRWSCLAMSKAAGVMLGAMQLLPTIEALSHSVRRSSDVAFTSYGSLCPWNMIQLIAPYLFQHRVVGQNTHELGFYVGAVPLVLAVWLLAGRVRLGRLRVPTWIAMAVGFLALLLAFGSHGPIYGWQRFLPVVGGFRFPCRYMLWFYLAAAVLSAIGFARLARRRGHNMQSNPRETTVVGLVVAAAALTAAVGLFRGDSPNVARPALVLAGPVLFGLAGLFVWLAARGVRGALIGLVLLAAVDLGCYGMSYAVYPRSMSLSELADTASTPPSHAKGRILADPLSVQQSVRRTGNGMLLSGWSRADGYVGLDPAQRLDYHELSTLQAAGVRWVLHNEQTDGIEGLVPRDRQWSEVPGPLPRVRLVCHVLQTTDDPAERLAEIPIESTALIEEPLNLPPGEPGTVVVLDDRPGQLRVRVNADTPQLLVVSESFYPGWQARIGDRTRPVWRVNGDFFGYPVPAGQCEVLFEFQPESLRRGRVVSLLGWAVMLASVACVMFAARRQCKVLQLDV